MSPPGTSPKSASLRSHPRSRSHSSPAFAALPPLFSEFRIHSDYNTHTPEAAGNGPSAQTQAGKQNNVPCPSTSSGLCALVVTETHFTALSCCSHVLLMIVLFPTPLGPEITISCPYRQSSQNIPIFSHVISLPSRILNIL